VLTVAQAMSAARVLKALADPVRLRLVSLIVAEGQSRVGDLGAEFDLSQPTITHHLNVLFDAGLLLRAREGSGVLYRVNVAALNEAASLIATPTFQATPVLATPPSSRRQGRALPGMAWDNAERALARGIEELAFRYAGSFVTETIDRYVH